MLSYSTYLFLQLLDRLAKAFSASDVKPNFSTICLISETNLFTSRLRLQSGSEFEAESETESELKFSSKKATMATSAANANPEGGGIVKRKFNN